jgi:hypothetical protein
MRMKPHYLRTWSRVGLREEDRDNRSRMIAETYSTVGRSLPLAWLMYGKSTVSDQVETGRGEICNVRIVAATALRSRIELFLKGL